MLETALVAFTTFFATIGPISLPPMFAALTSSVTAARRRAMALKGTLIGAVVLLLFVLFGDTVLRWLGISLAALRAAGGILLLLIAIDMVFARSSGLTSTTEDETHEAEHKQDISVFPLATPLIAGPGAMGAAILLAAEAHGDWVLKMTVIAALLAVLALTLALLLLATQVQKLLGVTGMHVITRVVGVLLSALAVQFIFDGVAASGVVGT